MMQRAQVQQAKGEATRLRVEQEARDTRRRAIFISVASIVVVGLTVLIWSIFDREIERVDAIEQAAAQPIEGVQETVQIAADHVDFVPEPTPAEPGGTVLPPMGGAHEVVLQNCGVYTEPVVSARAVHSLEHGAVWIAYRTGLDEPQVNTLTTLANTRDYTLLSPIDGLAAPVVLTAWGIQLEVDDASDPRIEPFLVKYVQGEQTPEPGAPCTGGSSDPA